MKKIWAIVAAVLLIFSASAQANESKEGGSSPYATLETLTVNLKDLSQYLQVNMVLKVANPEVSDAIKGWTPVIRHELILLLSGQNSADLATLQGKKNVMASIRSTINKTLKLNDKDGVTDVLFESFVIQ